MNDVTVKLRTGQVGAPERPRVGKDILELVSTAMYLEPLTVFREYIQNAADAVDLARDAGLIGADERGRVDIAFDTDPRVRSVRIRDNGAGLPRALFFETLTALGGSAKRGAGARGFRGVGRLSGLGYAREVIFRSRAAGEADVAQMTWDCLAMRAAMRDAAPQSVEDLISAIVRAEHLPAGDFPTRFFEVELRGVIRQGADRMMSPHTVHDYLAQIAPVPFSSEFSSGQLIEAAVAKHTTMKPLDIEVEGVGPIFRPHRDEFEMPDGRTIHFEKAEVSVLDATDEGVAGIAWILHHDYEGALPTGSLIKGLRARAGDVQIGDHTLFEALFTEERFNAWTVGEVHVFDRRLLPNGRRDHFEASTHLTNLSNQIGPIAKEISARCRTNSARRKWLRDFESHQRVAEEKLDILKQGTLSGPAHLSLADEVGDSVAKLERIAQVKTISERDGAALSATAASVRAALEAAGAPPPKSPLDRLPPDERAQFERFFDLVYECSINRVAAKALVDRILEKLAT